MCDGLIPEFPDTFQVVDDQLSENIGVLLVEGVSRHNLSLLCTGADFGGINEFVWQTDLARVEEYIDLSKRCHGGLPFSSIWSTGDD